jgi:hydrogenase maturation protease
MRQGPQQATKPTNLITGQTICLRFRSVWSIATTRRWLRSRGRVMPMDHENSPSSVLLLGVGNILLQDEGLGVHALRRLAERYHLPPGVEAVDGGVHGLDLLPMLEDAQSLLIIDAIHTGQAPGTIVRLEGEAIPSALALKMSMHQLGLQELLGLASLRGTLPARVVLWGMQPGAIDWGLELTPPVAAGLDELVDAVVGELATWGEKLSPI